MALAGVASAEEAVDFDRELHVHAFVSQGFLKSTDNDFLADSSRGSFEFFEAGLNVSRAMSDQLRLGMQLFSRDLGPNGDYKVGVSRLPVARLARRARGPDQDSVRSL
jgi:hypothetical protein